MHMHRWHQDQIKPIQEYDSTKGRFTKGVSWQRTTAALAVLADENEAAHELGIVQLCDGSLRVLRNQK